MEQIYEENAEGECPSPRQATLQPNHNSQNHIPQVVDIATQSEAQSIKNSVLFQDVVKK